MELHLGEHNELLKSFWISMKVQTVEGDTVGICYKPPEQEVDKAFYRQMEAASQTQALVLMGDFSHPGIYWRSHTAKYKHSRRFLESTPNRYRW